MCVSVIIEEVYPQLNITGVQEVQQDDSSRGCSLTDVSSVLYQLEEWCEGGDHDCVCESNAVDESWRCGA